MKTYFVRNVSEALWIGMQDIEANGELVETRNGPAYEFSSPVGITYSHPRERVLFYPERDANPFFHCLESLWMLAGRNDVAFVSEYSSNISRYSDDGEVFHGAYGYRWRHHWNNNPGDPDQLLVAAYRLKQFPNDRRTVVAMWDPATDLKSENLSKDVPCNTHIYFSVRGGYLHMTVCNRSNDMIWGAFGANAVHMSYLMEYMAARVGVKVGQYTQFTNNLHAYKNVLEKTRLRNPDYEPYNEFVHDSFPLVADPRRFDDEVRAFCNNYSAPFREPFLELVAAPMRQSWKMYKDGDYDGAVAIAGTIGSEDWRRACVEWLGRRRAKRDDRISE
jgi:hypothetical protein